MNEWHDKIAHILPYHRPFIALPSPYHRPTIALFSPMRSLLNGREWEKMGKQWAMHGRKK